jgi:drug/metabolite transporter (DMT)-like permease
MALLAALWGASYMFIEIALDDLSPVALVFARTALGALVLAPVAAHRGAFAAARRHAGTLAVVGLVQIAGPFVLIAAGQHQDVPSSLAGILVASAPIFTALLAGLILPSERLKGIGLVGIAVGMAGVALLFGVDLAGDALLGGAMILLASVGYAVGALLAKRRLDAVPPVALAASIMMVGAIATAPLAALDAPDHAPSLGTVAALLALGAGGTGVAFLIFYTLNADVGPSRASVVAYLAPAFSVLYGVTLLDEPFTVATAGGLALILVGSYLAAQGRAPTFRRSGPSRSSAPAPARAR